MSTAMASSETAETAIMSTEVSSAPAPLATPALGHVHAGITALMEQLLGDVPYIEVLQQFLTDPRTSDERVQAALRRSESRCLLYFVLCTAAPAIRAVANVSQHQRPSIGELALFVMDFKSGESRPLRPQPWWTQPRVPLDSWIYNEDVYLAQQSCVQKSEDNWRTCQESRSVGFAVYSDEDLPLGVVAVRKDVLGHYLRLKPSWTLETAPFKLWNHLYGRSSHSLTQSEKPRPWTFMPALLTAATASSPTVLTYEDKDLLAQCAECGAGGCRLLRCSSCRAIAYCSEACSARHWRSEHRHQCTVLQLRAVPLQVMRAFVPEALPASAMYASDEPQFVIATWETLVAPSAILTSSQLETVRAVLRATLLCMHRMPPIDRLLQAVNSADWDLLGRLTPRAAAVQLFNSRVIIML